MLLWKSNKYYIFWVCVCNLSYLAWKAHASHYIVIYGCLALPCSSTLSKKTERFFWKKLLNIKCVFRFSVHFSHVGPVAQSVWWLITRWTVRDRIPVETRFSEPVQTGLGAHPASCKMGTGSFPGGKVRPERAADHSPPSSAAVMEEYNYTSTHPLGHTGPVTVSFYLYSFHLWAR